MAKVTRTRDPSMNLKCTS